MATVDGSFSSPLQGVSQQLPRDRVDGQCTEQVNLLADAVQNLTRRPPLVKRLNMGMKLDGAQYIDFQYKDKYLQLQTSKDFMILTNLLNGETYTLNGDVPAYMDGHISLCSVSDTILVANTDIVTQLSDRTEDTTTGGALVYCRGGTKDYTYSISIVHGSTTYSKSYKVTDNAYTGGDYIITQLYNAFNGDSAFKGNYNISRKDDVIYFQRKDGQRMNITVSDEVGGEDLVLIVDTADDTSKLPRYAPNGYTVTITHDAETATDNFYLRFEIDNSSPAFGMEGVWQESAKPGLQNWFDLSTMPHKLEIDEDNHTFTVSEGDWLPRRVGDLDSSPTPSFIGSTINHLSSFQGRLLILSQSTFMTQTKKPFECWRKSATVLADNDPIDIASGLETDRELHSAVQYNQNISLNADDTQFVIPGDRAITPASAALVVSSKFNTTDVNPVSTGTTVIYATQLGQFAGCLELYPTAYSDTTQHDVITNHVNKYLSGRITNMVSNSSFNTVVIQTDADKRTLYVYKYLYAGEQKVQSAWSKWVFPVDIEWISNYRDDLYVTYTYNGVLYSGKISLDFPTDYQLGYTVYLDNRDTATIVNGVLQEGDIDTGMVYVIAESSNPEWAVGLELQPVEVNGGDYTFPESFSGTVIYGLPTQFEYIPSVPYVKDDKDVAITTGRLNITQYIVTVQETATFMVDIIDVITKQIVETQEISTNMLNHFATNYDQINAVTQTFNIPFRRTNDGYYIRLRSNDYTPFTLTDLEWKGRWFKHGTRVS